MSPFPETESIRELYHSVDEINVFRFFRDAIGPNERWVWVVPPKTHKQLEQLYKERRVNFEDPIDREETERRGKHVYRVFYPTSEKGFYLVLEFDDYEFSLDKKRKSSRQEFHRLGEKINEEYIISITQG